MEVNENIVDLQTLKSQGFTDEDLASVIPQEEVKEEVQAEEPKEEPKEEPSQTDSDTVSKEVKQSLKPSVVAYDRFKEVNDKAKALAAELAALRANKEATPAPVAQQPQIQPTSQPEKAVSISSQRAKYYEALTKQADIEAREILGIEQSEDISTLQFTDAHKYQVYLNAMTSIVQERDSQNKTSWKIQNDNEQFVAKLQQDPLFPQVYAFIDEAMEDLPRREVKKIDIALQRIGVKQGTADDFKLIEETYNTYKQQFVKLTGVEKESTPVVQAQQHSPLEKAAGLPRANSLSGAKTATMSWSQVEDLIRQGRGDEIPADMLKQIDPKLLE